MVFSITLILAGLIASAHWLTARQPSWRPWLERLTPMAEVVGIALLALSLWGLIAATQPQPGIFGLSAWLAGLALGFLHGFEPLVRWILRQPTATVRAQMVFDRLSVIQAPLGLAAIVLGVGSLL